MSHSIFIDESNGNGLFAITSQSANSPAKISTTTGTNNYPTSLATSVSNEDLSQSLSEYTDAEESMSAPTEFLAEFLSAVMLKDYKKALEYCKLILQYEPNNATAKEFYPLILEKLKSDLSSSESDENYNKSYSPEIGSDDMQPCDSIDSDNSHRDDDDGPEEDDDEQDEEGEEEIGVDSSSDDSEATSEDSDENILEAPVSHSSSSGGGGGGGISRSDNTTHSYSSLLLEDEDDVPQNLNLKDLSSLELDASNGNLRSASCSDSESPTEPLTQRLAAILRSKCVPGNKN